MKNIAIRDTISNSMPEADVLYARTFRWFLYTSGHPDVHVWMKRLKVDHVAKSIYFEVYEDTTGHSSAMLASLGDPKNKEVMLLDHLGPKNKVLFTLQFTGLKLVKHTVKYDYEKSDVLTHRVTVHFKKMERNIAKPE